VQFRRHALPSPARGIDGQPKERKSPEADLVARLLADAKGWHIACLNGPRWFDAPPSSPALPGDLDQRPLIDKTSLTLRKAVQWSNPSGCA
jgi:hypothetical protein